MPRSTPITPVVHFGSHLPVLIKVMSQTSGPALEMGMGLNSSLVMHWMCATAKRPLVSNDWDKADIEKPWDVAFLDHSPAQRRIVDIKRLASFAKYIIIHDSEGRRDKDYHYTQSQLHTQNNNFK